MTQGPPADLKLQRTSRDPTTRPSATAAAATGSPFKAASRPHIASSSPKSERFKNDDAANSMLSRGEREPYGALHLAKA